MARADIRQSVGNRPSARLVVVSTFAPQRDGIARYADQFVDEAVTQNEVLRIGHPGAAAETTARLDGGVRPLRIIRGTRKADSIVLMWHPQFFISGRVWSRVAAYLSLGLIGRMRRTTFVIHEPDNEDGASRHGLRRLGDRIESRARRWCWDSPASIVFHSCRERDLFLNAHPGLRNGRRFTVTRHGAFFRPSIKATRAEARRSLALEDGVLFLCVGFIGRHKSFDRALRAFAELPHGAAKLEIVGSLLYETTDEHAYLGELCALADEVPGARIEVAYLSDVDFDLWIQAADAVLIPYRTSASSGVVARARMFGTRVVASPVGGIREQLGPDDFVVNSDQELRETLLRLSESVPQEVAR